MNSQTEKYILSVPYFSQKDGVVKLFYGDRGCGIVSLKMVIDYFSGKNSGWDFLKNATDKTRAFNGNMWTHDGLIGIARIAGMGAYRIDYNKTLLWKTIMPFFLLLKGASLRELLWFMKSCLVATTGGIKKDIKRLLDLKIPLIVSLSPSFSADLESSHLAVLVGYGEDCFIIYDPWNFGSDYEISSDEFFKIWTKRAVIVFP